MDSVQALKQRILAILSESAVLLDEAKLSTACFDQWARTAIYKLAAVAVPDM
jgi:hypothetical protein